VATVSLAGSAAVLLWVDDQQGRVGTVTALARPGSKPASSVPPPPAEPEVVAAPAVGQTGLPKFAPKSLIKADADCDLTGVDTPDDIVARLAPGLVLWGPECQMAAYNEVSLFFLGDEHAGHLRRISFAEAAGAGQASDDELMNASFDAKTRTLSMLAKGRGPGDCGETASWVWDGKTFRLVSEFDMPECRGVSPDDWSPLYEARTK
jgi:hypothetical protein